MGKTFPGFTSSWADDAGTGALSRRIGYAGLDEDDVRVRPGKGSRPRTRRRPAHSDAAEAFVAAVDRGRYRCFIGDRAVTAMGARELGHQRIVVGDLVRLAGDTSGAPGALARVVSVLPRKSVLRRSADDTDPVERVIVANAEQLVIVCALADPPPRTRLIDRFLVAAYNAGLDPLLCLTKSDLAPPDEILAGYAPLGLRHVVTGRGPGAEVIPGDLRAELAGRASVLVGHSGVGKSTLVNALIPAAERAVGTVSPVTGRGQAHLVVGGGVPAARRRLDHRHARAARLRPRAYRAGPRRARVPGSGRRDRAVPARLHSPGGRLRPGRMGRRARRRRRAARQARLAAQAAAQPGRRRSRRGYRSRTGRASRTRKTRRT